MSPIKDQLTDFGQVTVLEIMDNLFMAYGAIEKINPEENVINMMGPYNPA